MESKHTPGPYRYAGTRTVNYANGRNETFHAIYTQHENGEWEEIYVKTEGTSRRIVLCVNAHDELVKQRDELLAAMNTINDLRMLIIAKHSLGTDPDVGRLSAITRSAIIHAQEGT